ncbi:unnamed protein product [Linum tenue]|uniref:Uncharacterized protein n=1 Tax=Linum tenue TaxID=586396 RepID=A0AAV0RXD7_9ROSI|nr:unnamed protein product [Linum tenue]
MENAYVKLLFCIVLLVLAVSGGKKNDFGVEGTLLTRPCKVAKDCALWGPRCPCDFALHLCICQPPHLKHRGLKEGH